jgi:ATP-dependent Lon protease
MKKTTKVRFSRPSFYFEIPIAYQSNHFRALPFPENKNSHDESGGAPSVYPIGTMAKVVQLDKATGKDAFRYSILVEGVSRISLRQFTQVDPYLVSSVISKEDVGDANDVAVKALVLNLKESAKELLQLMKEVRGT